LRAKGIDMPLTGALICLDLPQQEDGNGLRAVVLHWGGFRLCGDDAPYGKAFSRCLRLAKKATKNSPFE
jgi:hypothetical protein